MRAMVDHLKEQEILDALAADGLPTELIITIVEHLVSNHFPVLPISNFRKLRVLPRRLFGRSSRREGLRLLLLQAIQKQSRFRITDTSEISKMISHDPADSMRNNGRQIYHLELSCEADAGLLNTRPEQLFDMRAELPKLRAWFPELKTFVLSIEIRNAENASMALGVSNFPTLQPHPNRSWLRGH